MFCLLKYALQQAKTSLIPNLLTLHLSSLFSRRKRVRDLQEVKINLPTQQQQIIDEPNQLNYLILREQINKLNWQSMQFDKLCALPQKTLSLINMQIKKDKFNVDDSEFYSYSMNQLHNKVMNNSEIVQKLNKYYLRLYHLLMNNFQQYDQISKITYPNHYYTNEMYIMDLQKNIKLKQVIQFFINHIAHPNQLDIVAQPSFIKHLLSIKRELMLQGVHFQHPKEERRKNVQRIKKESQKIFKQSDSKQLDDDGEQKQVDLIEEQNQQDSAILQKRQQQYRKSKIDEYIRNSLKQSKINVKIVKVLGYEYQFWVDVKHNRSKNGVQEDYIIQQRQINNPNQSILVNKYPTINVKYIVHKKKRKNYSMHFCIKAVLLINVQGTFKNIKIQWRGPSNNYKQNTEDVSFLIVDYQNLMNGNPTIKPIFFF